MNYTNTDIYLKCPHGRNIGGPGCEECVAEIAAGMRRLEWEPGTLTSHELERILTDALADLWRDCYRRGNPAAQRQIFRERLTQTVRCATGDEGAI